MSRESGDGAVEMPLRDADLRAAAVDGEVRPGDELWSLLAELQRRRDADRPAEQGRAP